MAYEDITLTTSDNLAIKAYMIPARRNVKSREEMMGLSASQREEVGKEALGEWVKEMGEDDAFEVCDSPLCPGSCTFLVIDYMMLCHSLTCRSDVNMCSFSSMQSLDRQ
jgi:hypothetical protein